MTFRFRTFLVLAGALLLATPAQAGTPVPELDPSTLGTGIGLASAILLLLSHRRRNKGVDRS